MESTFRLLKSLKPYRKQIWLSWISMVFLVASDLAVPRMLQTAIDQGVLQQDGDMVLRSALIILGLIAVSAVATIGITVFPVRVSQNLAATLRRTLFVRVLEFSPGNMRKLPTGQLMIRLSSDIAQITQFIFLTMRMFLRAPLMIIGSLVLMVMTSWELALIMLFILPATIVVSLIYANKAQPMYVQVQRQLDRLNTVLLENLAGVRVVKAFVRNRHENQRFDAANVDLMKENIKVGNFLSVLLPTLRILVNLGIIAVVGLGGFMVIRGSMTIGQIIAFNTYLLWIMMAVTNHLGVMVGFISASDASAQRIFEVLDEEPLISDIPEAMELTKSDGNLSMQDVWFSYDGHNQAAVLQDIEFTAKSGDTVAILGATGSGKSTLVNLLPRFFDVHKGQVIIYGQNVREVTLDSLRAQFGLVPQETVLFTGSIRDNIRFGKPEASEEEVVAAAIAAQAHPFITAFPDGYDTMLGQRGVNISGGQKQRLAIARALLLNPRVLILDDSTSSVDVETEAKIQIALEKTKGDRITILVAQRISSVLGADKIIVLDQGQVAAIGTHTELIKTCRIYQEIYESQLGNGKIGL